MSLERCGKGPGASLRLLLVTFLKVQEVAEALLQLDGVDEVTIEVQDGGGETNAEPVTTVTCSGTELSTISRKRRRVRLSRKIGRTRGHYNFSDGNNSSMGDPGRGGMDHSRAHGSTDEMVPIGAIFDRVQNIFDPLVAGNGKRIELFMTGGQVEVRRSDECELMVAFVHIVRHFYDACPANGTGGDDQAQNAPLLISGHNGRSRPVIVFEHRRSTEQQGTSREPGMPFHEGNRDASGNRSPSQSIAGRGDDRLNLDIAVHLARSMGWSLEIEEATANRTRITLTLGPKNGVVKVMVMQIDEHICAIRREHVVWSVSSTAEERRSRRFAWQGREMPLTDLRTPRPNGVEVRGAVPGLILNDGGSLRCVLVTSLMGIQEMVPDAGTINEGSSGRGWGLLNTGAKVMICRPRDLQPSILAELGDR